jgi:hypothetical protein
VAFSDGTLGSAYYSKQIFRRSSETCEFSKSLALPIYLELNQRMPTHMQKISSPKRQPDNEPDNPEFDIHEYSDTSYDRYAKQATEDLVKFTTSITPRWPIVVTYFDEAHVLDESLWSMLRLLSKQDITTSMWYVFADTKSSISYFNPAPANSECQYSTYSTVSYGTQDILNDSAWKESTSYRLILPLVLIRS